MLREALVKPVSDAMAIDIINANYAVLQEDEVSRAHVHCWPLQLQAAPVCIKYLLNMSFIPCHMLLSFRVKDQRQLIPSTFR